MQDNFHWWKETIAGAGIVWSFLSDSRTLTAITVVYTGVLLFLKLKHEYLKWKNRHGNDTSRKPVSIRTTPTPLDE